MPRIGSTVAAFVQNIVDQAAIGAKCPTTGVIGSLGHLRLP